MTLDLEERIGLLVKFIGDTNHIESLQGIFKWITEENEGYLKYKGPFLRIKHESEKLKKFAEEEDDLLLQYQKIMLVGRYDPFDADDLFNDAAEIARKRQGLSEKDEVTIEEEDMRIVFQKQNEKRKELRGKDFDYSKPLSILIQATKKRANVYLNPNYVNIISEVYKLVELMAPFPSFPKDCKSEGIKNWYIENWERARELIRENIANFCGYLNKFFGKLTELIAEYPGEELKPLQMKLEKHPYYRKPNP